MKLRSFLYGKRIVDIKKALSELKVTPYILHRRKKHYYHLPEFDIETISFKDMVKLLEIEHSEK